MPDQPRSRRHAWLDASSELSVLAARLPAGVVRARSVSTLRGEHIPSRTFHLDLADGTRRKARLLESEAHAERVVRLSALVDRSAFPPVLDRCGRAIIEPWVDGERLADPVHDRDAAGRLGAILGRLHTAVAPTDAAAGWAVAQDPLDRLRGDLRGLVATRSLARRHHDALLSMAVADRPAALECGIVHRDAAPENAIRRPDSSLMLIDNTTLDVRPPDYDLARMWYRWPMDADATAAFGAAYRVYRTPPERGERFWRIGVLAQVVAWRRKAGLGGTSRALASLRAMAAA